MSLILGAFLSGGSFFHAGATQDDLKRMVSQSDAIFLGVCTTSRSRWDEAKRTIFTDSTFLVGEYMKGDFGPTITITEPGGVLPEFNLGMMIVPQVPQFRAGEEVALFVVINPSGVFRVLGGLQGKHAIGIDHDTGDKMIQGMHVKEFLHRIDSHLAEFREE